MKLSTKGRYGLKAMVDLAVAKENQENGSLTLKELAALQGISEAYLERILSSLRHAELISSARGIFGGYTLSREAENINVGEILRALEGSTTLLDCVDGKAVNSCSNACACSARPLWLKLQRQIDSVLNATSLKDMSDDYILQLDFIKSSKQKLPCKQGDKKE